VSLVGLESIGDLLDLEEIRAAVADDFYWLRLSNQAHLQIEKIDPEDYPEGQVIGRYVRTLSEKVKMAEEEKERRIAEQALQLGIALLQGKAVLK
jgi:hypothetical protein